MRTGRLIQLRPEVARDGLTDDGLAAAVATGDRVAQGELFERHADAAYRFFARMHASSRDEVDDLVQATFLEAFRGASKFRGPQLRSWLFGIAANVLRSHIRREVARRRVTACVDDPALQTVDPGNADLIHLRAAIAQLSPKLREVLVLVDLEGERGVDVAAALGIPEGTVWRRLSDARAQLRESIGGVP